MGGGPKYIADIYFKLKYVTWLTPEFSNMTLESTIDFNDILEDIYTDNNATINAPDSTYIDDIQQIKRNENYLHKYNILNSIISQGRNITWFYPFMWNFPDK